MGPTTSPPASRFRAAVCALALLATPALAQPPAGKGEERKPLEARALAKVGRTGTAYVECPLPGRAVAAGSAFCVHRSGLFVTNRHVVQNASGDIRLVLNAGAADQKVLTAKVVRESADDDLALLRVSDRAETPALGLGSDDGLSELQTLVAFGFPFGNRLTVDQKEFASITVSALKVSSLRNRGGKLHRIQLDGALNPGNSGGPVLDDHGRVVGVVVSGIRGSGLAEAIPVSHVHKLLATPALTVVPPTLTAADQGRPVPFEARVATFVPAGKVEAELSVTAGGHTARTPMTARGDTHTARLIALPAADGPLAATLTADGATIPVRVEDRKFRAGGRDVQLAAVRQVDPIGAGEVTLLDGTRLPGPVTGLGQATFPLAGQSVTVDLGKVARIAVAPREVPTAVTCTVVVRVDGKEAARQEQSFPVAGAARAAAPRRGPPAGPAAGPTAPALSTNRVEVPLPSVTDLFCVGGGGRYVILRLPKERKLAVFDASVARVVKYLPLPEDTALIAAGAEKLFVALPNANAVQRYDLGTFEKEVTAPVAAKGGPMTHMLMGSASRGPVLLVVGRDHSRQGLFLDAASLKPVEYKVTAEGGLSLGGRAPWDQLSRVSADGTAFTWWGTGSPGGFNVLQVRGDSVRHVYTHTTYGHLTPSPDAKVVYTGRGAFTADGKPLNGAGEGPNSENYLVPALQGRYYLRLPTAAFPYRDRPPGPPTLHIEGDVRPLATLTGVDLPFEVNPWDREKIGADQRVMLIPSAKLLVVVPGTDDRLVVHKLDIEAVMEASGIDYLLVTSTPVTAARTGAAYTYDVAVKARKGGVRFKLESGPDGMAVDPKGRLTWAVPADFAGKTADILLTITDAAGQEIFHSFQVAVE